MKRHNKPTMYWIYAYERPDAKGAYNFDTTRDFSKVKAICQEFFDETDREGNPAWAMCEVLGGDENGPVGDYDSFPGGWVR